MAARIEVLKDYFLGLTEQYAALERERQKLLQAQTRLVEIAAEKADLLSHRRPGCPTASTNFTSPAACAAAR